MEIKPAQCPRGAYCEELNTNNQVITRVYCLLGPSSQLVKEIKSLTPQKSCKTPCICLCELAFLNTPLKNPVRYITNNLFITNTYLVLTSFPYGQYFRRRSHCIPSTNLVGSIFQTKEKHRCVTCPRSHSQQTKIGTQTHTV